MRMSVLRGLTGICCVAALLGGCVSLPDASAPRPFDVSVPDSDPIELLADGPSDSEDPESLIQDFLLACAAGPNDDFTTARLFLTSSSARNWKPESEVLIYDTASSTSIQAQTKVNEGDGEVRVNVSVPAVASVDEDGVMTLASNSLIERTFTLRQENGQWRIDAPEDACLISQASFMASYELVKLQFTASSTDALIPDPRWYPARRLAGHLLAGLVAGPRESLLHAASNSIPGGTTIPSQGVEVNDGVAHVNLNAALPSDSAAVARIAWQISETLRQVSNISEIELQISGQTIDTKDLPAGPSYSLESGVALTDEGLATLSGTRLNPVDLGEVTPGVDAHDPAVSPVSSELFAWRHGTSMTLVSTGGGGRAFSVPVSAQAEAVTIDRFGWVWAPIPDSALTVGQTDGQGMPGVYSGIAAANIDGVVRALTSDGETSGVPISLRVSPDGARVLILRQENGNRSLWIATIERDGTGAPVKLWSQYRVFESTEDIIDASWAGMSTVTAVVASGEKGDDSLVSWELGGFLQTAVLPANVTSMSAGASAATMIVEVSGGPPQFRSGAFWQTLPESVRDARYSG